MFARTSPASSAPRPATELPRHQRWAKPALAPGLGFAFSNRPNVGCASARRPLLKFFLGCGNGFWLCSFHSPLVRCRALLCAPERAGAPGKQRSTAVNANALFRIRMTSRLWPGITAFLPIPGRAARQGYQSRNLFCRNPICASKSSKRILLARHFAESARCARGSQRRNAPFCHFNPNVASMSNRKR
jgi:hypothetical protein